MTDTFHILRVFLLGFLLCNFSACVHKSSSQQEVQKPESLKNSLPTSSQTTVMEQQQIAQALQKDVLFYKSLLATANATPAAALTTAELGQIRNVAALQTRHVVQNAILVVAAARLSLSQQNLMTGELAAQKTEENNLERCAVQLDVKIANSIEKNPMLTSPQALVLLQKALEANPTTPAFDAELRQALNTHVQSWQNAALTFGLTVGTLTQSVPENAGEETKESEPTEEAAATTNDELTDTDAQNILDEAATLANKGDFKQAIKMLAKSPPQSPAYQAARERITQYSDQGVQQLRGRSASEFQNFQQVATDPAAKLLYLKKSRTFLQDALKDYPDASMLGTVRSNLDFVEREISKVEERLKR